MHYSKMILLLYCNLISFMPSLYLAMLSGLVHIILSFQVARTRMQVIWVTFDQENHNLVLV